MNNLILASTSPRRQELMKILNLKFTVVASDYEEDMNLKLKPFELAKHLSLGKAKAVAKKYKRHVIIAADTFVVLKNDLLGKPCTALEAKEMLARVSGKQLAIITGFTIMDTLKKKTLSRAVATKVWIKELSSIEIDNYIKTGEPLDKAGAFAVQGIGAIFIEKIEGDFFGVVGLPLGALTKELRKFGINVL